MQLTNAVAPYTRISWFRDRPINLIKFDLIFLMDPIMSSKVHLTFISFRISVGFEVFCLIDVYTHLQKLYLLKKFSIYA